MSENKSRNAASTAHFLSHIGKVAESLRMTSATSVCHVNKIFVVKICLLRMRSI